MKTTTPITAAGVAAFLGRALHGPDLVLAEPCGVARPQPAGLCFVKRAPTPEQAEELAASLVLVPEEAVGSLPGPHIGVGNPRAAYAEVVAAFYVPPPEPGVHPSAIVASDANLSETAIVGPFCVIGPGAVIGEGSELRSHVVVGRGVRIGQNCLIKSNAVIGEEGFGIECDADGNNIRLPHLGSVCIGNFVEIGALNTVCSGTIDPTVIGDYVKTDDHVHVAHNVVVGRNSIITACAEISGSVTIGERVWLGPNCSIMNGVTVGDKAVIGLGAVVSKSVGAGEAVFGNPARERGRAVALLRVQEALLERSQR